MAFILKDRVKESTTTTGTGNISLGGALATFDTFQTYLSNGDTTFYAIAHTSSGVDEWEVGLGTWNTGNTLTRTTVLAGSNSTSAVTFSAGTKDVFMTYPASKAIVSGEDAAFANITVTGTVDGRDIAADGTKLDGVEASADVTDTANVTSAGALMRSGGTMTGNLVLNANPSAALGAATKQYVDTEVSSLVDSAPSTLDTLNELAAALGDDANFSTTVTNSIATKLPLAGGTITGYLNIETAGGPSLTLKDTNGSGTAAALYIDFDDSAGSRVGYVGIGSGSTNDNWLYSTSGKPILGSGNNSAPQYYNGTSYNNIFHDGYHPNADTLTTARTINGVSFNGSANITIADSTKLPLAGGTMSGQLVIADNDGGQPMLQVRNHSTTNTGAFTDSYTAEIRGSTSGSQTHGMLINLKEANDSRRTLDIGDLNGVFASFVNGNLLVSKTTTSVATAGVVISGTQGVRSTVDGNVPVLLNRLSDDGNLIDMRKDGTLVGTVSVSGGDNLKIGASTADHGGLEFATHIVAPLEAGSASDGTISLGASSARFSDLHLSGAVNAATGTYAGSGTASSPTLAIDVSSSSAFVHSQENLAANLASTQTNIIVIGKEGSTKNSGYLGFNWTSAGSNSNYVSLGHWGNNNLFRVYGDGTLKAGTNTIWHQGNDGSGSGLDADLLDGVHASGFVRGDGTNQSAVDIRADNTDFVVRDTGDSITNFIWRDHSANTLYLGTGNAVITARSTINANSNNITNVNQLNGGTPWTSANDGSGSGLDADLLDGVHASNFIRKSGLGSASYYTADDWLEFNASTSKGLFWSNFGNGWHIYPNDTQDMQLRSAASTNVGLQLSTTGTARGYVYANSSNEVGFLNSSRNWSLKVDNSGNTFATASHRAPIFYDSNDTAYYVNPADTTLSAKFRQVVAIGDGSASANSGTWGARLNLTDQVHSRIDVQQDANSMVGTMYVHQGHAGPRIGSTTAHPMYMMYNGAAYGYWDAGQLKHDASVRSPIFYDSNDTTYYLDPASTSDSALRVRGGALFGGNTTWGDFLMVGGDGRQNYVNVGNTASVATTDGNLHLDAASGHDTYINYYDGNNVYFGNGSNGQVGKVTNAGVAQFNSFTDNNNTAYYVDPATLSRVYRIQAGGSIDSTPNGTPFSNVLGAVTLSGQSGRACYFDGGGVGASVWWGNGNSPYGAIDSDQANGLRLYYNNSSGSWSEQFRVSDGYAVAVNQIRAPIFYDTDNTGYYTNPAATSNIYSLTTASTVVIGGNFTNNAYSSVSSTRLLFGGGNDPSNYFIGTNLEDFGGNYTKLDLRWHTGIRMGAQAQYGGIRLFNNEDLTTLLFSVGKGDTNTRVESGSFYAPIFYDSTDTTYYVDPASRSVMGSIDFNQTISETSQGGRVGRNHAYNTLELQGYGAELMIGAQGTSININYRSCNNGTSGHTPTQWYWRAGTSTNWSNHSFGSIISYGILTATSDVRAPVFYDSDNTGYFTNPAGYSKVNSLLVGNQTTHNANTTYGLQVHHNNRYLIALNYSGHGGNHPWLVHDSYDSTGAFIIHFNGVGDKFQFTQNGNGFAASSFRAPVFYDSSNTSYYFDGSATGDSIRVAGNIVAYYSDERLKDIEGNIDSPLEKVSQLNGFYYTANKKAQTLGYKDNRQVGVSAQEVEAVMPEIVTDAAIGHGYKTVDYAKLVPLLIEAVKEQQDQIETLKSRLEKLEN